MYTGALCIGDALGHWEDCVPLGTHSGVPSSPQARTHKVDILLQDCSGDKQGELDRQLGSHVPLGLHSSYAMPPKMVGTRARKKASRRLQD